MTKLFNVSKFVLTQSGPDTPVTRDLDLSFLFRLRGTVEQASAALVVTLALVAAGCASATHSSTTDSGRVKVVAAFYPVAAAAQRRKRGTIVRTTSFDGPSRQSSHGK